MYPKRKNIKSSSYEEDFYSEKCRETLLEEGALSNEEEGFMKGYLEAIPEESVMDEEEE